MAVFRVEKNRDYTVMSNHHLRNKQLSLKAKGLLSQMLSLPDDWDYTLQGLTKINRESVEAIRTAVLELEKAGYIRRQQLRNENGKMGDMIYTIYEQPLLEKPTSENPIPVNPMAGKPIPAKPMSGKPVSENPLQLNIDIPNKEEPSKDRQKKDQQKKYVSNTDSLLFSSDSPSPSNGEAKRREAFQDEQTCRYVIQQNISYDLLAQNPRVDPAKLDELVDIMVDTVCASRKRIRIAGDDYAAPMVRERFLSLTKEHILYVMDCMNENTTAIRNMKQYLRAVLFNAPVTMEHYYASRVAHDENQ